LFIQAAAEEDILRQVEWYAEQGLPHIAERFHGAVMDAIDRICDMPEAGPQRPTRNRRLAGLRAWPVKGFDEFWIYYLVRRDVLTIARVLHSKRDVASILRDQAVDEP
jgi:plasmid stabilization system protein ParE